MCIDKISFHVYLVTEVMNYTGMIMGFEAREIQYFIFSLPLITVWVFEN